MSPLTTNLIQCSDCEAKSYRVHDPMHTFLKIHRPVDMPGPLESEFPIIPILYVIYILRYASSNPSATIPLCRYRDPAGPAPGSPTANTPGDPAGMSHDLTGSRQLLMGVKTAYLRNLTHAFALCDRHMRRIVGKWYRCAFCAKDLCTDCEVLDTHDGTHAFLVFKAPVDMQAFRCAFPHLCRYTSILTDGVLTDTSLI